MTERLKNPHPGDILKTEFLDEIGMSQNALAKVLGVPANRIHAIVNGTTASPGQPSAPTSGAVVIRATIIDGFSARRKARRSSG